MSATGGPAFPLPGEMVVGYNDAGAGGMSLRDYFAGQVLANPHFFETTQGGIEGIVEFCYDVADIMILEREKT